MVREVLAAEVRVTDAAVRLKNNVVLGMTGAALVADQVGDDRAFLGVIGIYEHELFRFVFAAPLVRRGYDKFY